MAEQVRRASRLEEQDGGVPASRPSITAGSVFLLRAGRVEDALCVGALATQVFFDTYATDGIRPDLAREGLGGHSPEAFAERLADPSRSFLLAERDGHLAAFAELRAPAVCPAALDGPQAELVRLYVQGPFQGGGLGRALLDEARSLAASRGAAWLWLTAWAGNARALAVYRRLGWRELGSTDHVVEDRVYENRVFALELRDGGKDER